ncbi:MAG TPA: GyrI-like domain-containing protein [Lentzea sp.]
MQRYDIRRQVLSEQPTAVAEATLSLPEIGPWLTKTYNDIAAVLAGCGIEPTGPPFARYHQLGGGLFRVEAGFPVGVAIDRADGVHPSVLPGGPVVKTVHLGPYEAMWSAYDALASWLRARGGENEGDAWEVYYSDPELERDPATWRTGVVQPYRTPLRRT